MTVQTKPSESQIPLSPTNITRWWMNILMGLSQLVITLVFCTAVHSTYWYWDWVNATGVDATVSLSDTFKLAIVGATLMVSTGYALEVLAYYVIGWHRLPWQKRVAINLGLYLISVGLILFWFSDWYTDFPASFRWLELGLITSTAMSVLAAEAVTQLLWASQIRK